MNPALIRAALLLFVLLAGGCSSGGADVGHFTLDNGSFVINEPGQPLGEIERPAHLRAPTETDVRVALAELEEATPEARLQIFATVIEYGPRGLPEIDRALAYERDEFVRLDLMHLRTVLLDMEAKRSGAGESSASHLSELANPPDVDSEPLESGIQSDYGLRHLPDADQNFSTSEVDKFVLARLQQAIRHHNNGESQRCIEICDALILLAPGSRWRRDVQQVLRDARDGEQSIRYLAGSIQFSSATAKFSSSEDGSFEKPITVSVYLKNVSRKPVRIDFGDATGAGRESLLTLNLEASREDAAGQSVNVTGPLSLSLKGPVRVLQPNEAITISEELPGLGGLVAGVRHSGTLTRVAATGELRVSGMAVNLDDGGAGEARYRPISLSGGPTRANLIVVPPELDLEAASNRPASLIRERLESGKLSDLFLIAPLVGEVHRQACLDILLAEDLEVAGLNEQISRLRAARTISGEDAGPSVIRWREWWTANRGRFTPGLRRG